MKETLLILVFATSVQLLSTKPAVAHHSFAAEFDITKPMTLTGKVTKVEWTDPHAYVYMDVQDPQTGAVTNWAIEGGTPNTLFRLGVNRNSLAIGTELLVDGYEEDWSRLWWVRASVTAREVHDAAERAKALEALVEKYPQYRTERPRGRVFRLGVTSVRGWSAAG